MKHEVISRRRATNLTIAEDMVAEARELGVNLSKAAEVGIAAALRSERHRRWKQDNREALASWSRWMDENGSPLDRHRAF